MSCRNRLRGRAAMSDKRDLLLTMVFFKFMEDRYNARRVEIQDQNADEEPEFVLELMEKEASYGSEGVICLQDEYRWSVIIAEEPNKLALAFDNAITKIMENEPRLANALPSGIFTKTALEASVLKAVIDDINKIDPARFHDRDLIGRVYEYFLQSFSINAESKEEGEFYTPHSIVQLIASLIEPYDGIIYDPCCGSGGMFVQSARMLEERGGDKLSLHVIGQESVPSTYRLAKMNLAIRGFSFDLGEKNASTFEEDQHPGCTVDYVMANPPFNLKPWKTASVATDDPRWAAYGCPPESNANYAWILHILSKLDPDKGIAGFLLANGALDDADTLEIRKKLIREDKVEAIIVLPREMFYRTDISVTLWILNNNKKGGMRHGRNLRNREHEFLFIDLRTWNNNIYEKKFVQLTPAQIAKVCNIYHNWQSRDCSDKPVTYAQPELYYSAGIKEVEEKNWSLAPSRYIEFVDRDQALEFDSVLADVGEQTAALIKRQKENQEKLITAFKTLGYEM